MIKTKKPTESVDFINQSLLSGSYAQRAFPFPSIPHPVFSRTIRNIIFDFIMVHKQYMSGVVWHINHSGAGIGGGDGDDTIKRAKVNKSWINHKTTTELSSCDQELCHTIKEGVNSLEVNACWNREHLLLFRGVRNPSSIRLYVRSSHFGIINACAARILCMCECVSSVEELELKCVWSDVRAQRLTYISTDHFIYGVSVLAKRKDDG